MTLGVILTLPELAVVPGVSPSYPGFAGIVTGDRGLLFERDASLGSLTNNAPVEVITHALAGVRQFTFLDDYYFRVYLIPRDLDLGAIVATVTRQTTVWNATLGEMQLNAITPAAGNQTVYVGPDLPIRLRGLQTKLLPFRIEGEGRPEVDDSYAISFDLYHDIEFTIAGTRSQLWPFLPNWREAVTETLEFSTEVFTSRDGHETQRRSIRTNPRLSVEYTAAISGADIRSYRELMDTWQDHAFILPNPRASVKTTTELTGDTATVDGVPDWLVEGAAVAIFNGTRRSTKIVADVVGSVVTFEPVVEDAWPVGTKLYQTLVVDVPDQITSKRLTNDVSEVQLKFEVHPGTYHALQGSPGVMFNGREVFLRKPNWAEDVSLTNNHPTEYVDYGRGKTQRFSPSKLSVVMRAGTFVGVDQDSANELISLFNRMKGQRGEFYMPTWESEMDLRSIVQDGANSIRVQGPNVAEKYAEDETRRAFVILLRDGTAIFRAVSQVLSVSDVDGDDSVLEVDEPFDQDVSAADVRMISWVQVNRFSTDTLSVEWLTNTVAQMVMTSQTLPDEEPETP